MQKSSTTLRRGAPRGCDRAPASGDDAVGVLRPPVERRSDGDEIVVPAAFTCHGDHRSHGVAHFRLRMPQCDPAPFNEVRIKIKWGLSREPQR